MSYLLRSMRKEDIPQVTEIDREAFPNQWPPPNYQHELQNQLARYIVACDDSQTYTKPEAEKRLSFVIRLIPWLRRSPQHKPVTPSVPYIAGFAGIWVLAEEAHITNIAVRKSYQQRGIGELLLLALIDLAQELKATNMTLEVRASNTTAQNLYRKYGFLEVGVRKGYYIDNREDGIIMSTENIHTDSYRELLKQLREAYALRWGMPLLTGHPSTPPDGK